MGETTVAENYVVAVLSDRIRAEKAYFALEKADVPMDRVSMLGRGYQSADEYGLIDPDEEAEKQSTWLSYWLIPFGFFSGAAFSVLSGLQTFAWAGEIGNHVVGGFMGAAGGAMGAFVVGRLTGFTTSSGDALTYRNRLNAGKYLIIAQGSDALVRQVTAVIRRFEPENIQGYEEKP
ncbi:MAG: hypothetical protein AAFX40_09110 [Cyanobacteria bacterium J06639_1]